MIITKHECVGHVQKRVGTRLRAVKKIINHDKKMAREKLKALKDELKELKKTKGKGKGKQRKEEEAVKGIQAEIDAVNLTMVRVF